MKDMLAEKIAGEITLSPQPGATIKKWRESFSISQTELARHLAVSPSVISDYESERRRSPGVATIRKLITALMELDEAHGARVIHKYTSMMKTNRGIMDIREYPVSIPAREFVKAIDGQVLVAEDELDKRHIHGFTLIDSIKAIAGLNSTDYIQIYGWSTERALVFTGIRYGRSPMIAVRVHPMKPSIVVYHKPESVDILAHKLAEYENIPLIVTELPLDELHARLRELFNWKEEKQK
ncbi:MAG: transcriptional regulator [Thermoplasmata archaeon HGW-Thermoplasmata-1]|nr:MAG: transcriptional regulator [Thermoplasmata archaeon HGW-Thermoplasmata-1]